MEKLSTSVVWISLCFVFGHALQVFIRFPALHLFPKTLVFPTALFSISSFSCFWKIVLCFSSFLSFSFFFLFFFSLCFFWVLLVFFLTSFSSPCLFIMEYDRGINPCEYSISRTLLVLYFFFYLFIFFFTYRIERLDGIDSWIELICCNAMVDPLSWLTSAVIPLYFPFLYILLFYFFLSSN